jgi:flavin reductase (DIM6/NTAB) family NADH-FMN oxidoreductase RutF
MRHIAYSRRQETYMPNPKVPFPPDKRAWRPSPLVGQIVLVTTLNEDGGSNVAPKSWISMMAFDPPLLALGCTLKHWTARNILRSREFVVNIPGDDLAGTIWAANAHPHPRPVESVGLTPIPAQRVKPPLIAECKAHLECEYVQHLAFGDEVVLLGSIVAGSVDSLALEAPDPYAYLRPLVFLEGGTFGVIERAEHLAGPPLSRRPATGCWPASRSPAQSVICAARRVSASGQPLRSANLCAPANRSAPPSSGWRRSAI